MCPSRDLPALDCHAHIAPDVKPRQVHDLGPTVTFAMTRSLAEARHVARRTDHQLVWGLGVHPGVPAALDDYSPDTFRRAHPHFAVVGEVGLDRRGPAPAQRAVFDSILDELQGQPVLISVHSTGRIDAVLDAVEHRPHPGLILHWFTGNPDQVARAVHLGCFFSINAAMTDENLHYVPEDRWLPETDFPSSRKRTGAAKPGHTHSLEERLAVLHDSPITDVRLRAYENLRAIAHASGALRRLPDTLATLLANLPGSDSCDG